MQAGRDIPHPRGQDNKHELEEMRAGRGLLQRRLRTAFDDPTWSDLAFRCPWPPLDVSTRAELLQGSGEEPSSPPSPPSPAPSPTRGPAPELEVFVHRVVVAAWSDALAQLCRLHGSSNNNKEKEKVEAREGEKVEQVAGEIRGGDGDTTTQGGQQLKVLDVFEEEGEPTQQRGSRRTVVELQATEPGDPSALRLLLAFLYSGDLAQALDDTAACRLDGSGAQSNADHRALVRPHIMNSILQDAAGSYNISPADRQTAKMVVARAANLGLGYGVPELHQQFKSSSMWIADTESSPTTPPHHKADEGRVESPLDALLAAASQHPLVRASAIPAESPVTTAESKLGGFQEGRSLRGSTERRVPARFCSPDVEVYKGTWEVRGKRKPAPAATSPSPASPTLFSPPTVGRRSARLMEQELTVAETTADVMAVTKEREAVDDDSEQDPDSGSSALDAIRMPSVARRSSRRHSGGLERKPAETDIRKKRRKEEVEEVDEEEEEEDDDEYDQRHESMRVVANANKKRRAVAKAKQTRESAAAVPPPEENADEETFILVETNDHPTVDTIVPSTKSLPAAVLVPRSATELASPRGVSDVAVDQPVVTETQVLAAAAASGQIRRSLKQLRKEHGKNCHNCKTRKIDFVTCLVRPTHRFCDGCLRKLFNVEFANAHTEWDGIVHPEGCAICRHMCPCVGCRKRAHPLAAVSPARSSSDASRKAKRSRDDADAEDQHAPQRASGSGHCAAGSGDNDDSPRTKNAAEKNEKKEEKKKVKEEKKTSSKRRRTRSLIDGRESQTQQKESEDRVRRSSLDMHEDEDSVEMMTDADSSEQLASVPPGKSTRSRSRRRESAATATVTSTPPGPQGKSTRSSARRSGGGGSRSAAKGFNVPEGAGPEAFLGLVSAGSALSQRPTRRTPIRAPSADD